MSNSNDGWLAKAAASGIVKAIAYHAATAVLPFFLAALTLLFGRLGDGASWMWSLMAASMTFGGTSAGMFYVFELAGRRAIDGKLVCVSPRIATDITTGDPSLGFNLQSMADVPVEFEVKQIRTEIAGVYSASKPFDLATFVIPPRGAGFFSDYGITVLLQGGVSEVKEASIRAVVCYGSTGSRKYNLDIKRKVHLRYNADGIIDGVAWNEAT